MNPFIRFYDYFTAKSVRQRIYIAVAFTLLLVFAGFIITGNVNKNSVSNPPSVTSDTSGESAADNESVTGDTSGEGVTSDTSQSTNEGGPKFHISLIDMAILLVVITFFAVHKFREKRKHGRL